MYLPIRPGPSGKLTSEIIEALQRPCNYQVYKCLEQRLSTYDYCMKHILEDKSAPFRQCTYIYSTNGKKCPNSTPITDKKEPILCAEHTHMAQLLRQRTRRPPPPQSVDTILGSLTHYVKPKNKFKDPLLPSLTPEEKIYVAADPFEDIDAIRLNSQACRILEYASESDSDQESTVLNEMWKGLDEADSDPESIDTPMEDPLKYCGVYTAEEVTLLTKDKLIRLQALYIDQFRRLQHRLRERRRKYIHALKKEKETLCSVYNQPRETAQDRKLYNKLKSLNRYHKRSGVEAILHKKALERRAQATDGVTFRTGPFSKCIYTEDGIKCGEKSLPVAKYCHKHILEDHSQVLFRACGCIKANIKCKEPIFSISEDGTCDLHDIARLNYLPEEILSKDESPPKHGKRTTKKNSVDPNKPSSSQSANQIETSENDPCTSFSHLLKTSIQNPNLANTEDSTDSDIQLNEQSNFLEDHTDDVIKDLSLGVSMDLEMDLKEELIDDDKRSDEISEKEMIEKNLNPLFEENISELMNSKLEDNIVDTKEELKSILFSEVLVDSKSSPDSKEDPLLNIPLTNELYEDDAS